MDKCPDHEKAGLDQKPGTAVIMEHDFFARTAKKYDEIMNAVAPEHTLALAMLTGLLNHFGVKSLLDVGAGTGRVQRYLKTRVGPDTR